MSTELVRIPFHGRELQAMLRQGEGHLVLRPACDDLGLDFSAQLKRLKRQPWAGVVMMAIPSAGGPQDAAGLHVDSVPMWLATIQTSRVKPERRPLLIAYQKECARVLRDHFIGKVGPQQQSLPFDHVALRIELAELRGKVDALLQLRGGRPRRAAAQRRSLPADLTEAVRALVKDQAEAMTHAVIEGLGLALTRGNEMLVGQVLRALGYGRALRRRVEGGRVYVYTKAQAN